MRISILALALLLVAACESPGGTSAPRWTATDVRAANDEEVARGMAAYAYVADCLSMTNQAQLVYWRIATRITVEGQPKSGMMIEHTIYIRADYADWAATYRHESMHHILWRNTNNSDGAHSNPRWTTCAELSPGVQ